MIQVFVFKAVTVYHCVWEGRGHISAGISELASLKKTTTTLGQCLHLQVSMAVAQSVLSCLPRQHFLCQLRTRIFTVYTERA